MKKLKLSDKEKVERNLYSSKDEKEKNKWVRDDGLLRVVGWSHQQKPNKYKI